MSNTYFDEIYTAKETIFPSEESRTLLCSILTIEQVEKLYVGLNYEISNFFKEKEELNFHLKWLKNFKFKKDVMKRIDNNHFNFRLFLEDHHLSQIKSNLKNESTSTIKKLDLLLRLPVKQNKYQNIESLFLTEIRNYILFYTKKNLSNHEFKKLQKEEIDLFNEIHDSGDKSFHGFGRDIFTLIAKDFRIPFHSDRSLHNHILKLRTMTP